jgi:hypothetical protein
MAMTEEEFLQKARALYRQASESEKDRIERDKHYFHDWIQRLIGWIGVIWDWIVRLCFLSSVACSKDGQTEDCEELTTLRRFRDEYLLGSGDLARKKDVDDYYRIAPGIWLWIEGQKNSAKYWEIIRNLLLAAVSLIQKGQLHEAHMLYKNGILGLVPSIVVGTAAAEYNFSDPRTSTSKSAVL